MPPPRAIIFDLLTALLDSWSLWDEAAEHATITTATTIQNPGHAWRTHYLYLTFHSKSYTPYPTLITQAAHDIGLPASAPSYLLSHWDNLTPWPEAQHTLTVLKEKGYLLGVVSNCSVSLGRRALARVGMGTGSDSDSNFGFDAFVTAEEVGFYKPHPSTYGAALEKLGVDASEAVFVAGSNGDVSGAGAVGMSVFWHNRVGLPRLGGRGEEGRLVVEGRDLGVIWEGLGVWEA